MMRVGENHTKNNISMLAVNYGICFLLSVFYKGINNLFQTGEGMGTALMLGLVNGFFYIASLILFQSSVKQNGLVLSSIFMKLGIMVPLVISILLFHEIPTVMQVAGFVLAIIAIVIINLKNKTEDHAIEKIPKINFKKIGLLGVLVGCGLADGMSKIYQELGTKQFEELFLVITFIIAFALSIVLIGVKKQKITKNEIIYGAMLGVPNYYSARFLLKALGQIPAVVAYPTFSIGTIAVITLTGIIVFREKLTKRQMIAIGLIAVAVVLLN